MAGLVTRHGITAVQDVLGGAADAVRSNPNEDPDRRAGPIIATALLGVTPAKRYTVWLWNLEDPW
jgi:hypothetical protein